MSFKLNAIFIQGQALASDQEILNRVGFSDLEKIGEPVDFYETNKQRDSIFIGSVKNCKLICNGKLANEADLKDNPLLNFKENEIAVISLDDSAGVDKFCLIKNGKIVRSMIAIAGEKSYEGFGTPIQEELDINIDELFTPEEKEEIIEFEGEDGFKQIVVEAKIAEAANNLAKRYLGTGLMEIKERIKLYKYE